jgi:hypothetical protein
MGRKTSPQILVRKRLTLDSQSSIIGAGMKKKFVAEVLKQMPSFRVIDHFFYEPPVDHVMCGFAFQTPPLGMFICKYAVALYDHVDEPTLSLGQPLSRPDDLLEVEPGNEREMAAEFLRRIEPYRSDVDKLKDLSNFLRHVRGAGMKNPWIRRDYATTLIMLGDGGEALTHLKILDGQEATRNYPHFNEDISRVLEDLSSGIEVAQATLLKWEAETKRRFGLEVD